MHRSECFITAMFSGVTEEFEARESVAASMQSLSSLRALRAEQAKLKAEYDRMEV